jgi:lysophospholipase L1-like esterase
MKIINNSIIIIIFFLLITPYAFSAQELWTAWADQNQEGSPIYLAHYQDAKWKRELFVKSSFFDECYMPCPGINPEGRFWLVWVGRRNGENPALFWSIRDAGEWTKPRKVVEDCNEWEYAPAIAFDPEGDPRLAWAQVYSESTEIFSAGWDGDGFTVPEMVSIPDRSPDSDPAIAFGEEGEAIVVWQSVDNGLARIFESRLVGGEWTEEEPVTPETGVDQVQPSIRCPAGSDLIFSWNQERRRVILTGIKGNRSPLRTALPLNFSEVNGPDAIHSIWMIRKTQEGTWDSYRVQPRLKSDRPTGARTELLGAAGDEYYVGYGDSITYGHDSGGDTSRWYGSLLKTMLESARPGRTYSFYNKGYPGAYTSEMLYGGGAWGCPGINSILSDYSWATYILIMGGTNDVGSVIPLSTVTANLGEIITRTNSTGIEPVLSTIIPRVNKTSNFTRSTNLSIDYIPPLASSMGCLLADPFAIFMQYYPSDYFWFSLYEADFTHPRWEDGDDKIAEAWFAALATPSPTPAILVIDSDDYNGDGTSDISIFRALTGLWAVRDVSRVYFGSDGDIPVPADYNNDGSTDIGIFRPSNGLWAIRGITRLYYGSANDIPIPGDYTGTGLCRIGIFRKSTGLWAIRNTSRAYFGNDQDQPIPGYYGWGRTKKIAIFRPSSGLWAIRDFSRIYFGNSTDIPAAAAYNGGVHSLVTIFRPDNGLWAVRDFYRIYFGGSSDTPAPGDFDGDGTDDIAIFRPGPGLWAVRIKTRVYFGQVGDTPLAGRIPYPITPTPSPAPTATPSPSPSPTPSASPSPTPSITPSPSPTVSPSPSPTSI